MNYVVVGFILIGLTVISMKDWRRDGILKYFGVGQCTARMILAGRIPAPEAVGHDDEGFGEP